MTDVALLAELGTCGHAWLLRLAARVGRASLEVANLRPSHQGTVKRAIAIVERAVDHWSEATCKEAWWAICAEFTFDYWWVALLAPDECTEGLEESKLSWFWINAGRFIGHEAVASIVGGVLAEAKEAR